MSYNILLADDSFTILEVMTFAFEKNGFNITSVSSQKELDKHICSNSYNLIIIDNNFLKNELLRKIKNSEKNKNSYIFILSENSNSISKHRAKKLGASGWIIKPFIPEKLVKTIKTFLISNN